MLYDCLGGQEEHASTREALGVLEMWLAEHGDEAYRLVQENAQRAWDEEAGTNPVDLVSRPRPDDKARHETIAAAFVRRGSRVRVRLLAGIVTVGFVLAMTACGDDGNVATTTPKAPESASGKAAATPAETPEELASCLEKAGYTTAVIPAPPEGAPGAEFGSIGTVRVEVSRNNSVVAVFFENAKQAKEISKGALAALGAAEVVGTVYLAANQGRPQELEAFRTCLKG